MIKFKQLRPVRGLSKVKGPQDIGWYVGVVTKPVTKPAKAVTKPKGGRPKRYETAAERQAAYRARKKTNG